MICKSGTHEYNTDYRTSYIGYFMFISIYFYLLRNKTMFLNWFSQYESKLSSVISMLLFLEFYIILMF